MLCDEDNTFWNRRAHVNKMLGKKGKNTIRKQSQHRAITFCIHKYITYYTAYMW